MAFADELRNYNSDNEKRRIMNMNIDKDSSVFLGVLEAACRDANAKSKRSVSIFVKFTPDEYGPIYSYLEELPTFQEQVERTKSFNKSDYRSWSTYHSASTGTFKTLLYGNIVSYDPNDSEYIKALHQRLNSEVAKMGFTSYKVSLVLLDNIVLLHNRSAGVFSGRISEKLSTTIEGKIYTFNLQAEW